VQTENWGTFESLEVKMTYAMKRTDNSVSDGFELLFAVLDCKIQSPGEVDAAESRVNVITRITEIVAAFFDQLNYG
jgi:hypothetical protein